MELNTADANISLFGHPLSGHSYKVALMLAMSNIPHQYQTIDLMADHSDRPEPFRDIAKYKEVPLLLIDDEALVQSNAILLTLAERTRVLGGESPERLRLCREWLFWESNRLGFSLAHLRFVNRFNDYDYNDGALSWLRDRYDKDIARLAEELDDGREFIINGGLSIADLSLFGYIYFIDEATVPVPDSVRTWKERIESQPNWAHADVLMPLL